MKERMDLPKMPWTIRMAIGLLDALCVIVVASALKDCVSRVPLYRLEFIGAVWLIGLDVELRRGWCALACEERGGAQQCHQRRISRMVLRKRNIRELRHFRHATVVLLQGAETYQLPNAEGGFKL